MRSSSSLITIVMMTLYTYIHTMYLHVSHSHFILSIFTDSHIHIFEPIVPTPQTGDSNDGTKISSSNCCQTVPDKSKLLHGAITGSHGWAFDWHHFLTYRFPPPLTPQNAEFNKTSANDKPMYIRNHQQPPDNLSPMPPKLVT